MSPTRCLAVKNATAHAGDGACFYDDLTLAVTGEIEGQDCSALAAGECAVNCPCTSEEDECRFLSETRPVGLCAQEGCSRESDGECKIIEDLGGCVHLAEVPDWSATLVSGEDGDKVYRGYCATAERCTHLQARYPGVYRCEYGDD